MDAAMRAVEGFLRSSAANGTGLVVGAYLSEESLLAIRASLRGLGVLLTASPVGPAPHRSRASARWTRFNLPRHVRRAP